ncbi:MAG TPA: hypothetical protein DCS93_24200 [Microscillaceae bacterium]|nr:hypothetical protein [Microscillaceae bacterium]
MGKRQIRIFEQDIAAQLPQLADKELSLVLKNDLTLKGKIYKFDQSQVFFKDTIRRKHVIEQNTIAEIIVDHTTDY